MFTIETSQQIQDMARGAVLLGTGGGGDPYVGEMFVSEQIRKGHYPRIINVDELSDDAFVLSIAGIGAPTVGTEQLISERLLTDLLRNAEAFHGRRVDALISVEIGGGNSIMPLALGALSGLPIVDADGVGRAVPQIEMTTFSIYGCPASPLLLADALGNSMVVRATTDRIAEDLCRAAAGALGAHVTSALYPMSGADAKRVSVRGSLSLAYGIGRCIREAREGAGDIFEDLTNYLETWDGRRAAVLFDGKIADVRHETRSGWHWGQATLSGLRDDSQTCVVDIRNEFLSVRVNGRLVTMMPDLIAILDRDSAEPMTGGMLAYGQRVKVLGFAADKMLRHPDALEVLGPRAFGIEENYVPIEELLLETRNFDASREAQPISS
jgi:uncharacterized protein